MSIPAGPQPCPAPLFASALLPPELSVPAPPAAPSGSCHPCPICGSHDVGGRLFPHQRVDVNHPGLACESIYFNAVEFVPSPDSM